MDHGTLPEPAVTTVAEAAVEFGFSPGELRRLIADGRLRGVRVGRRQYVVRESVSELLRRGDGHSERGAS